MNIKNIFSAIKDGKKIIVVKNGHFYIDINGNKYKKESLSQIEGIGNNKIDTDMLELIKKRVECYGWMKKLEKNGNFLMVNVSNDKKNWKKDVLLNVHNIPTIPKKDITPYHCLNGNYKYCRNI